MIRYPYIGNPLGFKLPDPKSVIHPIIYKWDDLPEDQKEELETIKKIIFSIIGECEITLFGSIVKGYWDDDSDYRTAQILLDKNDNSLKKIMTTCFLYFLKSIPLSFPSLL